MTFALLNRLIAKPGERDRVIQKLIESGKLFDSNDACILYLVAASEEDPDVIWVVDLWTTEGAHARALRAPELRPHVSETIPLLEGPPEQIKLNLRGGKGIGG